MEKWIDTKSRDSDMGMRLEEGAGELALPKDLPCGTPYTLCILCSWGLVATGRSRPVCAASQRM